MVDFTHKNARPFFLEPSSNSDYNSNSACLLIHGFTGAPGHMRPIGQALSEAGYAVSGIMLPGHGSNCDEMEKTTWVDWLRAARDEALRLRKTYKRVYVGGLSMGGCISLILAAEGISDCCLSFSSPILIHNSFARFAPFVWPFYKRFKWDPPASNMLMPDYDFGYNEAPVRRIADLRRLIRMARDSLAKIMCPVFVVQSHLDKTVKPQSAQTIFDGVASVKKDLLWLEKSGHVCTIGPETKLIIEKLVAFLRETDTLYDEMGIHL